MFMKMADWSSVFANVKCGSVFQSFYSTVPRGETMSDVGSEILGWLTGCWRAGAGEEGRKGPK